MSINPAYPTQDLAANSGPIDKQAARGRAGAAASRRSCTPCQALEIE